MEPSVYSGVSAVRGPITRILVVLILVALASGSAHAGEGSSSAWESIKRELIGTANVQENSDFLVIDAPEKAEDSAVVPVSISIMESFTEEIAKLYLVIDKNPSPVAAVINFGPAAGSSGRRLFTTRVRIDAQSAVRAILKTSTGRYYMASRHVNAAGGCSATSSKDLDGTAPEGETRIRVFAPAPDSAWLPEAQVMIRHPNHNGMQQNSVTGEFVPARFIEQIKVKASERTVFDMAAGISISANPNIRFTFAASPVLSLSVESFDTAGSNFTGHYPQQTGDKGQ